MKKVLALMVLFMFVAGTVCFASDDSTDPVNATVEASGGIVEAAVNTVTVPVKAVVAPNESADDLEGQDPVSATVQAAGETVQAGVDTVEAPVKAIAGNKE